MTYDGTTHGGKAKRFSWTFRNDAIEIDNDRLHKYTLAEVSTVLDWLTKRFDNGWFPLGNNVVSLSHGVEIDGLGVAIMEQQSRNVSLAKRVSHAQGASYLGVILEQVGLLRWSNRKKGIEWCIIQHPKSFDELKEAICAATASPTHEADKQKNRLTHLEVINSAGVTKFNFLEAMQEFVAISAIGVSALRNQGRGSHQAVRDFLAAMLLAPLKGMGQVEYRDWIDQATKVLLAKWPGVERPWGAARKSVNLFMRDALYNRYLSQEHDIGHVEKWMEIALDSKVAEGLHRRFPALPAWPGLKHLEQHVSDQYQDCAQQLADGLGCSRVHLDIWLWLENR